MCAVLSRTPPKILSLGFEPTRGSLSQLKRENTICPLLRVKVTAQVVQRLNDVILNEPVVDGEVLVELSHR